MNQEMITIVDEQRHPIGVKSRDEVHKEGDWHETFHCWFLQRDKETDYIYFQLRSPEKKDFPNLLDITAAGHILAHETVADGVREIHEELGIEVQMADLAPVGIIKDCLVTDRFIDREFSHVYIYKLKETPAFHLQKEEVSGIGRTDFHSFYAFCMGNQANVVVEGFVADENGEQVAMTKSVAKQDFVPHEEAYWQTIAEVIKEML